MSVAEYAEKKAKEYGLSEVKLVKTPHEGIEWNVKRAELWLVEPTVEKWCDSEAVQLQLLDFSNSGDVTAELVDVGSGTQESDYKDKDVAGKLVFASGNPGAVMREACWKRGAAGIVVWPEGDRYAAHPEQIRWLSLPQKSEDGKPATFGFGLSYRQGLDLQRRLKAGKVKAHALVEVATGPGWLVMVEGKILGTNPELPCVVFTGHLQEERFSANDDSSGCANALEDARALALGIAEGKLPRPRRTMQFWWTTEIASENQLFADHPEVIPTILCDINQDMVGANQSQDTLRVQNVTRLPWSRSHLLEDVAEEVVNFLVDGNTSQLSGLQAGMPYYPFPVLSKLGTRHRYNARFVPYHANTDHQCFVAPPVGLPGITFTNWPDDYIHSTDDDLWNLDPTQLQRNALACATIGYAMARFGARDAEPLEMLVRSHIIRNLGSEGEVAGRLVREASPEERPAAVRDAIAHMGSAMARNELSLASVAEVTAAKPEAVAAAFRPAFKIPPDAILEVLGLGSNVRPAPPTETMKRLAALSPRRIGSVADYQKNRAKAKNPEGLHSLLAHEILCLADLAARRGLPMTGLELHEWVAAQARSAGPWYYGAVTPEQTLAFLESCEAAGLITNKRQ
jgi:hypothetical protein